MEIVRYVQDGSARVGVRNDGRVAPLRWASTVAEVLARPLAELREGLTDLGPSTDSAEVT